MTWNIDSPLELLFLLLAAGAPPVVLCSVPFITGSDLVTGLVLWVLFSVCWIAAVLAAAYWYSIRKKVEEKS